MSITIPAGAKAYPNPITVQQSVSYNLPREGKCFVPLEFDWNIASVQQVQLGGNALQPFSQIVMMDVDNSQCGVDVEFFFLDTTDTLVVPAYGSGVFPVFTRSTNFFAAAISPLSTDVTRVRVLNYLQEPVDNPKLTFANIAASTSILITNGNSQQLINTGTNGTISTINIVASIIGGATSGNALIQLVDGSGANLRIWKLVVAANAQINILLADSNDIAVRFSNGVKVQITNTGTAFADSNLCVNINYRTP